MKYRTIILTVLVMFLCFTLLTVMISISNFNRDNQLNELGWRSFGDDTNCYDSKWNLFICEIKRNFGLKV